jgi:hypothetical protein
VERACGGNYQAVINKVLRDYLEAKTSAHWDRLDDKRR